MVWLSSLMAVAAHIMDSSNINTLSMVNITTSSRDQICQ